MKRKNEELLWLLLRGLILSAGLVMILGPLYLVVINTFKSLEEAGRSFFSWPASIDFTNYAKLFGKSEYWTYVKNSLLISVTSVAGVVILVPTVSYSIARNMRKTYYRFVYFFLLMGLFIPSQVIMLPVTKLMSRLGLQNPVGLIILYLTFSLTQGVFLFVNYIRSLPYEIEEAARLDGCSTFQTYWHIILHLVKPMMATLVIMDLLWFWNDFLLPLLILNKSKAMWTLPIFQYNFKTEYSFDYTMAFTAYLMAMLPVLLIYCLGQKYIIKGLTAGSVKG